jgi:hypothetical protein
VSVEGREAEQLLLVRRKDMQVELRVLYLQVLVLMLVLVLVLEMRMVQRAFVVGVFGADRRGRRRRRVSLH